MTLFGFLGLYPVLVANENFVTQLSNCFLAGAEGLLATGLEVVTSLVIEALKESCLDIFEIGVPFSSVGFERPYPLLYFRSSEGNDGGCFVRLYGFGIVSFSYR